LQDLFQKKPLNPLTAVERRKLYGLDIEVPAEFPVVSRIGGSFEKLYLFSLKLTY
jgi:hypothetical protein